MFDAHRFVAKARRLHPPTHPHSPAVPPQWSAVYLPSRRLVAQARTLDEAGDPPTTTSNDVCDIMGETLGDHINTCDEWRQARGAPPPLAFAPAAACASPAHSSRARARWRQNGEYQVEIVDVAPTVMALLGLPVPRDSVGVLIDDVVGLISHHGAEGSMLGLNCTAEEEQAEAGKQYAQDRMCTASYGNTEDPSTYDRRAPRRPEEGAPARAVASAHRQRGTRCCRTRLTCVASSRPYRSACASAASPVHCAHHHPAAPRARTEPTLSPR
jgi:hypothetical protein